MVTDGGMVLEYMHAVMVTDGGVISVMCDVMVTQGGLMTCGV